MRWFAFALLVMTTSNVAFAGTIFTDNFESESAVPHPPGFISNYSAFQNWDVIGSGVDLISPGPEWPARIDSKMVDLDGNSGSTLITKQSFSLSPGTYLLSFRLGGPVGGIQSDSVQIELGSVFSELITIQRNDPFVTFNRTINVATATTGKLSFTDLGADSNGGYLDDVELASPVPEPSSLALLVIGAIGIVFRRRWRASADSLKPVIPGMHPAIV